MIEVGVRPIAIYSGVVWLDSAEALNKSTLELQLNSTLKTNKTLPGLNYDGSTSLKSSERKLDGSFLFSLLSLINVHL